MEPLTESANPPKSTYKERIEAAVSDQPVEEGYGRHSGVYFFLSLDLVNSTGYKARNRDWQFRIRMFYDHAKDFWTNHSVDTRPQVWKYAGDEVLFYKKVRSIRECELAVHDSYRALRVVSETVQRWTDQRTPRLYVKGVCWAAQVEHKKPAPEDEVTSPDQPRNIVFESPIGPDGGPSVLDFLGPEIDAGFRLAGGAIKNSLVVSAELAHLVRTGGDRETGDGLRLVTYRDLKGVWEGRRYPIVWYRADWTEAAMEQDFDYDDEHIHAILAEAKGAKPEAADKLDAILRHVRRRWLVDAGLPKDPPQEPPAEAQIASHPAEVHCVAVCFNPDGEVLLARRKASKSAFSGMWEAGCARLLPGEDFYSALRRDYKADFGLDLDLDKFRPWGVVGSYEFTKDGRTVPGVVFVAGVRNASALVPAKHDSASWYDPNKLPSEISENCVPDLPERVRRAFRIWEDATKGS